MLHKLQCHFMSSVPTQISGVFISNQDIASKLLTWLAWSVFTFLWTSHSKFGMRNNEKHRDRDLLLLVGNLCLYSLKCGIFYLRKSKFSRRLTILEIVNSYRIQFVEWTEPISISITVNLHVHFPAILKLTKNSSQ